MKLMMPQLTVEVEEIMILINYLWVKSFTNVGSNKTAITKRGWFPVNLNILLDNQLSSTMADEEQEEELDHGILLLFYARGIFIEIDEVAPTLDIQCYC